MSAHAIRKILILRFSSLGDIVMTTAMIRCVRQAFPSAQIDMVVRDDGYDLVAENPHLDQKWVLRRADGWGGLWRLLRSLNRERYDLIYDAHRSLRTRVLMPFLRAQHRVYFVKHYLRRNWALLFKWPRLNDETRFLQRFVEPLIPFGVVYDGAGPELFWPPSVLASAMAKLRLSPPPAGARRIGVVASAQWPGKRWPLDRFREFIGNWARDTNDQIIVFGGKDDTFVADLVRGLSADQVINAQGKIRLLEAAALLSTCQAVVANDTGLMHMADAMGVPSVLIFGPTSAELGCLPFHPRTVVLEHRLWCRPCSKNGEAPCIRGKRVCLLRTKTDDVTRALQRVLA